jgi:glycosyltransferase involved in cell wall biosynthesis
LGRDFMVVASKANILYIAHDTGLIGGAERQLLELLKGINRDRFGAYLACIEEGGPVAQRAAAMEVPVYSIPRKWRWDLGVAWKMRNLIKQHGIALVHAYLGLPGFYGALAGRLTGAKVITTIRIAGTRKHVSETTERLGFLISDRIISNSVAGVEYYFKRFPGRGKTQIIYNGYSLSEFGLGPCRSRQDLGLPENVKIIGHVANLTFLKDYPTFLRALTGVFHEESDSIAVIVGDGAKRSEYEHLAKDLGIWERILFMGHRSDVLDLVRVFDVCVLASHPDYSEGLSNSIAEYMGLAKPVVATAVGGNSELIKDGITGFLCRPGDPEDLADKILTLIREEDLRESMGKNGRRFFEENLTLERMVSQTEQVYEDLLARR